MKSLVCSSAVHEALKADDAAWLRLALVGVQLVDADEFGPAERLELRNCVCNSTLCRSLEVQS